MGRVHAFECPKCGFRTRAAGGMDRGLDCFAHSMVCHDCRRIFDAVTHVRLPPGSRPRRKDGLSMLKRPRAVSDLKLNLPDHLHVTKQVINEQPILPEPLLAGSASRWVELAVRCPSSAIHRIEEWRSPWRCPICQSCLDKSFVPYRIWE